MRTRRRHHDLIFVLPARQPPRGSARTRAWLRISRRAAEPVRVAGIAALGGDDQKPVALGHEDERHHSRQDGP